MPPGGRTLALFTSWKAMDAAAAAVKDRWPCRCSPSATFRRRRSVKAFSDDESSCLFATAGFFQGSTSPDERCRWSTIDRIPFPRPDDPLLSARRELLGPTAFAEIDLPRAGMMLAQATGRLIRSATDRGVVAVFDRGWARPRTGWQIIGALPPMRRTKERGRGRSLPSGHHRIAGYSRHVAQLVDVALDNGQATITLNSPANRNALSQQLLVDLHAAFDVAERGNARVVILTHTPPVFCAGADLKERATGRVDSTSFVAAIERLGAMSAPVIAAVDGPVRAGGVGLMAACDLVVVNPSINFAFTEVRIGVAPAIITAPILQRCGWSKLAAAYLTGATFDAARALDMGLITHISDDVAATVAELSHDILLGGPNAVAATKALLRRAHSMKELQAMSESLFTSDEGREGMAAFAEKRPPRWAV